MNYITIVDYVQKYQNLHKSITHQNLGILCNAIQTVIYDFGLENEKELEVLYPKIKRRGSQKSQRKAYWIEDDGGALLLNFSDAKFPVKAFKNRLFGEINAFLSRFDENEEAKQYINGSGINTISILPETAKVLAKYHQNEDLLPKFEEIIKKQNSLVIHRTKAKMVV